MRNSWISEYCRTCGKSKNILSKYFHFITTNYAIGPIIKDIDFNNSLVIIDEAHKFVNSIANLSPHQSVLYKKIMDSNCRVLVLTGTPIYRDLEHFSILGNLLNPGTFPQVFFPKKNDDDKDKIIIPNNYKISDDDLKGIVSYFPGDKKYYPTVNYMKPTLIYMTKEQEENYLIALSSDIKWRRNQPSQTLKETDPEEYDRRFVKYIRAIGWQNSRRASNFYYPDEIKYRPDKLKSDTINIKTSLKIEKEIDKEIEKEQEINDDNTYSINELSKYEPKWYKNRPGWISCDAFKDKILIKKLSPKITTVLLNITKNLKSKHVVYTFFKLKGGVYLLHSILKLLGIPSAIYSGDISSDSQRKFLIDKFNSSSNSNGELLTVLLVTEAGSEGINLIEVNNFHILESSDNEKKTQQAIGRVIRYKSHFNLPVERRFVNIHRYWSIPASEKTPSIDKILFEKGKFKQENDDIFLQRLIDNSIENS